MTDEPAERHLPGVTSGDVPQYTVHDQGRQSVPRPRWFSRWRSASSASGTNTLCAIRRLVITIAVPGSNTVWPTLPSGITIIRKAITIRTT